MSVVRTSDEWLSSSRWMAAVHPVTALLLFRPVLTQQPSLSSLLIARYMYKGKRSLSAAQREQTARAAQRRRFKRKPAGRSTFVTWTVDP